MQRDYNNYYYFSINIGIFYLLLTLSGIYYSYKFLTSKNSTVVQFLNFASYTYFGSFILTLANTKIINSDSESAMRKTP